MCAKAIRLPVESVGLLASHWVRSLENASPPIWTTLVAPVARTALSSVWNPATANGMPVHGAWLAAVLPFFQHCQPVVVLPVARSGNGSLNRSSTTALLPLKALATLVQNIGANCRSGIGFWQAAIGVLAARFCGPPANAPAELPVYVPTLQCISTIWVMLL